MEGTMVIGMLMVMAIIAYLGYCMGQIDGKERNKK
jgi:hypothetical protein